LAREAGLCGGGGYGVSDIGREDEHEVQARFLVRQAAYTRRGRGGGAPKGTSWVVIGPRPHAHGARGADARRRVAKGARDRSAARPRTQGRARSTAEFPESVRRRARTAMRGRNGRDVPGARERARRQGARFISFAQIQKCITP
jgi:hypothetical protein